MSDILDELYEKATDLYLETSKEPRGSYSREVWKTMQLGENLFQYNTGYQYKDGSIEGGECHIVWFEKGKLTPLKTVNLPNGYDIGPSGALYENLGNGLYESYTPDRRRLGYREFETFRRKDDEIVHISSKGIEAIKDDLSNLSEKDFLRLYHTLANSYKYRDALKERTFDITDKWNNFAELFQQRMEKYIELTQGDNSYEYSWLRQSPKDKAKLIEVINTKETDKIEVDENRLSGLKGLSIEDIQTGGFSKTSLLAAQVYDCSHLSGLLQVADDAPNTPAFDLISVRYREQYGDEFVNAITERADEIIKLPYKQMFFEAITKDNSNAPEANFLDAFTDKIRNLAMKKYGKEDWYTSISEAAKDPEFMKECDKVWGEMFTEADKYATCRPNKHDNAYIRKMFPDKAEQLHEFVAEQKNSNFIEVLDEAIKYHQQVGKMQIAINEYCKDNEVYLNGNLHFDLVDAGVETKKEAKRCLDIWQSVNERPDRYGSPYNGYSIYQIAQIAKSDVMQDWMYPVMMDAVEKGGLTISEGRMPSERTLFDCCKTWKICPKMPQRLAKEVGHYSLKGRMLAGAIFDKMVAEGNTTPQEWRENKELHQEFYEELDRAQKMPNKKALKQYISNTPVNRKRVIAMGMEEKGIEFTEENFRALYNEAKEKGVFEASLANPKEARTTVSSRLMVKLARQKNQGK